MIVYSSETCIPCVQLHRYLTRKGIEFRVLNADEEPHTSTLIKLTGRRVVPTTMIEGHPPIFGLNYSAINKAIHELQSTT